MEPAEECEALTWTGFGLAARELAQQIADADYRPDLLLPIARGGLVLAGTLSYALRIKNLHLLNVEFYTGIDERLPLPVILPPVPAAVDLSGQKVLIVDDVADTGETLRIVRDFCSPHVAQIKVAVLYQKPRSVVEPDFVWRRTDRWVTFPWSAETPLVNPAGKRTD